MDETTTKTQCAECGTDVPPDAPLGLCPACLLKRAMAATTAGAGGRRSSGGWHGGFDPPPVEQLIPLFPHLEILEFIGRGGMGAVYKARQVHLDRFVAVKVLPTSIADDPAFAERFAREARSLARLNHANIVTVHDFGRAGEFFFFVMEFVDGLNLRHALVAKTLEPRQALAIVPQICDALQYAHDEGIVHRDIKPENVLLDKKGRVKIADFGLAKLLQKTPQNYTLTQTYVTMGTPHYMAPEQTERPLEVDHRADIYSLGVVFYEMLTGELPLGRFAAPSEKAQIDARLDEVVFKTLEKEPSRRYQQASEVKTSVQGCSTPPPLPTSTPSGASQPEPVLPYAQRYPDPNPHYSRVAWAGAIWGALGFVALVVPIATGLLLGVLAVLAAPFLLFTITALVGMPVCGLIAISHIHRSNGQITGLRLATFDALAFPLLIGNAVLILCVAVIPARALDLSAPEALAIVTAIGLPVCAVLDFFIVRFAWRRISSAVPEDAPAVAPTVWSSVSRRTRTPKPAAPVLPYGDGGRYSRTALTGAAWAIVGLAGPLLILASYLMLRSSAAAVPPPAPTARAATTPPAIPGYDYTLTSPVPGSLQRTPAPARSSSSAGARGGSGSAGGTSRTPAVSRSNPPAPGGAHGGSSAGGGSVTVPARPVSPTTLPTYDDVEASALEVARITIDADPLVIIPTTAPYQVNTPGGARWSSSSYGVAGASGGGSGGSGGGSSNPRFPRSTTIVPGRPAAPVVPAAPTPPTWSVMLAPTAQLALFPLLAVAFTAPFGATILGLIAISQIRQSLGKLYGMPLAIFDTLVFPLLLLDALIVGGTTAVMTRAGTAGAAQTAVATFIGIALAIAADVWIVRRVRDAANTAPVATSSRQAA